MDNKTTPPVASPTAQEKRAPLLADVERIADIIAYYLGIYPGCDTSAEAVCTLLEKHGVYAHSVDNWHNKGSYLVSGWGKLDGDIVVRSDLSYPARATVIIHELVHRHLDGQAYEHLNEVQFRNYDGCDAHNFEELICRAVERRWVDAGGFEVRKSEYRR